MIYLVIFFLIIAPIVFMWREQDRHEEYLKRRGFKL